MKEVSILLKLCFWHRDSMVAGTLFSSVVASINIRCSGGSSIIFSKALNAEFESIWTSSIIYTRFLNVAGEYITSSRRDLTSSTLLFEAASISTISRAVPSSIARQEAHFPHGFPFCGFSQLTALARILAQVVLPVPLVPTKR